METVSLPGSGESSPSCESTIIGLSVRAEHQLVSLDELNERSACTSVRGDFQLGLYSFKDRLHFLLLNLFHHDDGIALDLVLPVCEALGSACSHEVVVA
ncbi:hypothetical protein EVAR_68140_1 [Eumeta japonica]|uniref:Uncharacterized protein n=1 Tax=Eumeta variegata TaxID=151549 RepID=A0A4C2A349_EUMVA|nr:hypothetical protein EVAR_68140_1 [Eumeta japonica]